MSGAFFALLILIFLAVISVILSIIEKIGYFLLDIIEAIISNLKEKHTDKKNAITPNTKTTDNKQLLEKRKKELLQKYSLEKSTNSNKDNFEFEKEDTYCERCFKRISEEEYEMNDCMCEDCYEDIVNGETF